jgi:arabinofuranosyltransferase
MAKWHGLFSFVSGSLVVVVVVVAARGRRSLTDAVPGGNEAKRARICDRIAPQAIQIDPRMSRNTRVVLLFAAMALYAAVTFHYRTELIDDAYISLRYARNLATGHGLVWNPGERVEGYTNFLWVLVLALIRAGPFTVWALGVIAGAALLVFLARLPRSLEIPGAAGALLPLVVAAHPAFGFWAAKGLETSLFSLLLTVGVCVAASARDFRKRLLGIHLLCLASLTRPEGLLFVILAVAAEVLRNDRAEAGRDRMAMRLAACLLPLGLIVPHVVFRLAYYGYPLPNTFYAKVGGGIEQWWRGVVYLSSFFVLPEGILYLFAIVALVKEKTPFRILGIALVAGFAEVIYVGGDGFGAHRFLVPLLPILCLLTVKGMSRVVSLAVARGDPVDPSMGEPGFRPRRIAQFAPIVLAILAFATGLRASEAEEREVKSFTSLMIEAARVLKARTPEGITIALNPSGAIPYYCGRRTIDMLGLNDVHIAHRPVEGMGRLRAGHEKGDGAYVLSRRPELILINNVWIDEARAVRSVNGVGRSEGEILEDPALYRQVLSEYILVRFSMPNGLSLKALALRQSTPFEGTGRPRTPGGVLDIPEAPW